MFGWFEKLIDPFPAAPPGEPPRGLMPFLWHYSRPVAPLLAVMGATAAVIAVGEVLLFGFLGNLVDWLSDQDRATFLAEHGWKLAGMAVVIVVLLPAVVFLDSVVIHQSILGNFPMIVRWQAHRYLLGQSYAFFQDEFAGRIATKVMQTALAVRESVTKVLDVLVYVSVYFVSMVVLMAASDIRLSAPMVAWIVAYVCLLWFFVPRLKRVSQAQADARSVMTGRIVDSYTNIATMKLFSHAGRESAYARDGMDQFLHTVYRQMRLVTLFQSALYFLNSLVLFAIAAVAIWLWRLDAVTLGAIAIAISMMLRLNGMSQWIMWEVSALFENIGTVQDGMGTLSRPQAVRDIAGAKPLEVSEGRIDFDAIRFHYGKEGGVIENLSLTLSPGEKVGLVGRSGAGKSTLVNLLLRFHDLEGGRILIDGSDIATVTQESLRAAIGMVTQDTSLLHRSVRENILYGAPDATEADVREAARQAEADDFIQDLSDQRGRTGYDAHVGERGVKLSGGQRQRIAIARVLLKNAPILVLDEATSALDSEVEAAIQKSLGRLMEGKTVIAIAHRLSTIAAMDRLVVMDKGEIVEEGHHEELLARGGLYASLWARQSGGFLCEDEEEAEVAE
ncbi:ATP-binding cassette subfamily B multidrug efflux pump [Rhodobium orientis]|uniref:Multidrug ABC transporter ATP-binding protein n=1 Tax=Rhodobium orientis TaxID=34017 RepID=A0A327JWT4_9HYPH|nr:ABC transporter ATP-binding protein [Rhodobium orientis]MBB4301207.1 ATP-binding cassette subfamily B multidrug efflux pump [Rhodobium orientis]MBK5951201.1 multidrug ABC transporter ATP-binding protein [Rhodobium orientis]RAI30025.1 multidrug ABC transporter ATP-binding protein [Rhodobium orientis]